MGWCFSSGVNENMPVSAETQLRFRSHEKTTSTYIVSFVGDTEQQNFLYRKKILSASVWKWNSTMSTEKYQSGLFNDQCPLLFVLFNPPIIFGRFLLGNVRSASSGASSFLDLDRSSFLAHVIYPFFFDQYRWIMFFFPRWANVFLADKMRTCHCRPKHSVGWTRTKKTKLAYIVNFVGDNEQQNLLYREDTLSAGICKKYCAMSAEKYQSGLHNARYQLLFFLFNPWIIFGRCQSGNVR